MEFAFFPEKNAAGAYCCCHLVSDYIHVHNVAIDLRQLFVNYQLKYRFQEMLVRELNGQVYLRIFNDRLRDANSRKIDYIALHAEYSHQATSVGR